MKNPFLKMNALPSFFLIYYNQPLVSLVSSSISSVRVLNFRIWLQLLWSTFLYWNGKLSLGMPWKFCPGNWDHCWWL